MGYKAKKKLELGWGGGGDGEEKEREEPPFFLSFFLSRSHTALHSRGSPIFRFALYPTWEPVHRLPPYRAPLAQLADFSFRPIPHLGACSQAAPIPRSTRPARRCFVSPYTLLGSLFTGCPHRALHSRGSPIFRFALYPTWEPVHRLPPYPRSTRAARRCLFSLYTLLGSLFTGCPHTALHSRSSPMFLFALYPAWEPVHRLPPYRAPLARLADVSFRPIPYLGACSQAAPIGRSTRAARRFFVSPYTPLGSLFTGCPHTRAPLARLADVCFRFIPCLGACSQAAPIPRSTRAARRCFFSLYTLLGSLFTGCPHTALHSPGSPMFRFALYPTWEPVHRLPPYRAPLAQLADFSFRPIPHLGACSQAAPIPRSTRPARRCFVSPYTLLGSLFTGCPHTALHSRGSPIFRFALYPTWVFTGCPHTRAPLARLADVCFRFIPCLGACSQAAPIPRSTRAARRCFFSLYTLLGSLFTGCPHTALHSRSSPIFRFALYPTWEPVHRLPPYRAPLARLADVSFRPIPYLGACSQAAPIPRTTRPARRCFVSPYTPLGSLFTGCPHTALHSRGSPIFRFALYPTWEPVHRLPPYPRSTRAARRFFVSLYTLLGSLFTGCPHTALHSRSSPMFLFALYPSWEPFHRLPPYRAPLARLADFSFRFIPCLGACSQAKKFLISMLQCSYRDEE